MIGPTSYACPCGFRDEVKQPAPPSVYCPNCKDSCAVPWTPPRAPPVSAGRVIRPKRRLLAEQSREGSGHVR